METPVLSKLQRKRSLTGKKNKKEIIKNVVVDPHKTNWPLVQNELDSLSEMLKENLPRVKPAKINVPWRLLKDIPKDKRKHIRNDYIHKHGSAEKIMKNDKLIFGVNDVTKHLESDVCSAVLVTDVIPRTVVKHIIEMAVLKNTPVLVVSTLKTILKDFCGIESMALAIKKDFESSSNLATIVKNIFEIYKNYPPSENHINAARCESLKNEEQLCCNSDIHVDNMNKKPVKSSVDQQVPNYHLIRNSLRQRAFVPELEQCHNNSLAPIECHEKSYDPEISDFFKTNKSHQAIRKKIMKKLYKPLTVKRIKGNKNRQKDKNKLSKTKK